MRKAALLIVGLVAVPLGALWVLQGLGIVHLRPLLCFADCASVQGPSAAWVAAGAVLFAAGGAAVLASRRGRTA